MKKILFVCTGNTCRSAMAEFILKNLIKKRGLKDYKVASAGLCVTDISINPLAKNALLKLKIRVGKFVPRQVDEKLLKKQNAIICMTGSHSQKIQGYGNVYTVDELTECGAIPDPYGGNSCDYEHIAALLINVCEKIIQNMN